MADDYRDGDWWVISDRTGLKTRVSRSMKEWTGAVVDMREYEPRHPQDFVRAKRDDMAVPNARPRPLDIFGGPLDTLLAADHNAGATTIAVETSVRMAAADRVSIMLDNGDTFLATISSVPDASHVIIDRPLPWAASTGKKFYDNTAMAAPEI